VLLKFKLESAQRAQPPTGTNELQRMNKPTSKEQTNKHADRNSQYPLTDMIINRPTRIHKQCVLTKWQKPLYQDKEMEYAVPLLCRQ